VILEDRNTVQMTFCMLRKSGEAADDREEDEEDADDVDDAVDEGRVGRLE
jgi:hypothetical protein